jgi:hypothetical protein
MSQDFLKRHFPTLLGRLPQIVISLPKILASAGQRFVRELLLAMPFVALFIALVARTWGTSFIMAHVVVTAGIVLSMSYLVALLILNQRREQSRNRGKS